MALNFSVAWHCISNQQKNSIHNNLDLEPKSVFQAVVVKAMFFFRVLESGDIYLCSLS